MTMSPGLASSGYVATMISPPGSVNSNCQVFKDKAKKIAVNKMIAALIRW